MQELFQYEVLKAEGKISDAIIENMLSWRHSGFSVYCGPTIWPGNEQGLEDLARYIIRACFSAERMSYLPKVISFIEDEALIKKILIHLGLWETRNHDPP